MSSRIYELSNAIALKAARRRLAQIPRRVSDCQTVIPVTQRGRPVMALMSWEMFESLVETIEIMSDPELMAQLRRSEKDVEEGRTVPLHEVMAKLSAKSEPAPAHSDSST